jgi:hypothetical protein
VISHSRRLDCRNDRRGKRHDPAGVGSDRRAGAARRRTQPRPKPLYRDPVTDGAADVSIVFDQARHEWVMFYTNRRAT